MTVGILDAISPEVAGIDWGGSPADTYIRFFESVQAPFSYRVYKVAEGQLPVSADDCDAYVITGSIKGIYDEDEWINELSKFIRASYQAKKKLVGICFGHQILAHSLGGRAEKSEKGENFGLAEVAILQHRSWMDAGVESLSLYFAHQDQVVELPPAAKCLAGNDFCPIVIFEIKNRVLGIQGHPEFSPGIMQDILPYIRANIVEKNLKKFVASLQNGKADSRLVAQWIVNFLRQA